MKFLVYFLFSEVLSILVSGLWVDDLDVHEFGPVKVQQTDDPVSIDTAQVIEVAVTHQESLGRGEVPEVLSSVSGIEPEVEIDKAVRAQFHNIVGPFTIRKLCSQL